MSIRLLNEKQVAEQIGMSLGWLRRKRVTGGGIPYLKMGNGRCSGVRYDPQAVEEFIQGRTRRSTSE